MYTIQRNEGGMPVSVTGETPNEQRLIRRVEAAIRHAAKVGVPISRDTARLIASVIHEGSSSALAQFAGTGHLQVRDAHTELFDTGPDDCPIEWWRALDRYLSKEVDNGTS